MPTVDHPRVRDDVAGHPPNRVTVGGDSYLVTDEGRVDLPSENAVGELARAYGLDADALLVSETCDEIKTDGDVCGRELPCPYHSDEED